jgi:aminoglycoside N3'-acetyltransferase
MTREFTRAEITEQLRRLGVARGGVLLLHSSYRATRPVEGGPAGLIEAMQDTIGPRGTLVMPSWTGRDDEAFDPRTTASSPDLGVVADLFCRQADTVRSNHAFAFAATGPLAQQITADGLSCPPHVLESPVGRAYEKNAQILLLGVGHDANTMLHLAESLAPVPYGVKKHITVLEHGKPACLVYREPDHCCTRFALADEWLRGRGLQSEGPVANAHARLMRARDVIALALEHLKQDPLLFLHPESSGCDECDAARRSVTN